MTPTFLTVIFFLLGAVFSGSSVFFFMRQKNRKGLEALQEVENLKKALAASMEKEQSSSLETARLQSSLAERSAFEKREKELLEEQFRKELENAHCMARKELENLKNIFAGKEEAFREEKILLEERAANELANAKLLARKEMESLREAMDLLRKNYEENKETLEKNFQTKAELFKKEFETISEKILTEKSSSLKDSNKELMENLLNPLREKMGEFQQAVIDSRTKGVELHTELKSELARMAQETRKIGNDAVALAQALKGEQKTQGNFGEMILEDLLERSGLKKGIHFESQETIRDDDGKAVRNEENSFMRPDIIIHYPDGKDLIVDSKMSLTAYVDYMNSQDETLKANALERHIRSVKNHVEELYRKDYAAHLKKTGRETVDFVVMFIPGEGPANLALLSAPSLWTEAFEKKVLIVSPINLLALLRLIHIAWTKEEQTRNQLEILDTAGQLLDRVHSFCEEFDAVGVQLEKALSSYQDSVRKLKKGERNRSVILSAEKLKDLGVKMKKAREFPARMKVDEELLLAANEEKEVQKEGEGC